jgi:hypothetical protein
MCYNTLRVEAGKFGAPTEMEVLRRPKYQIFLERKWRFGNE